MTNTHPNGPAPDYSADRQSIIDKINKLKKFTTENGCTEAEAATALVKLHELIASYNITQTELSIRSEAKSCYKDEFTVIGEKGDDFVMVMSAIGRVYGCKMWYQRDHEDELGLGFAVDILRVCFFGLPADIAACMATAAIIHTAVSEEGSAFKAQGKDKKNQKLSFRYGMTKRLEERLLAMKPKVTPSAQGTGLIVLKDQLVTDEFAKLNLHLTSGSLRKINLHQGAYAQGQVAGGRVDLSHNARTTSGPGQKRLS